MSPLFNSFHKNTIFFLLLISKFLSKNFTPMVSRLSSAMAGKTARACDSCIRKRARWYCAADDAFLCQACDGSVHSANPLACRHERVRLKTASVEPPWTTGFTRKARTPRRKTKSDGYVRVDPVHDRVPEIGADETMSYNEMSEEQHVMYRVPFIGNGNNYMEFDDFGGDVESLLGFDMEDLGLVNCGEKSMEGSSGSGRVKFEKEEEEMDMIVNENDMERETFEVNFDNYECPLIVTKESSEEFEAGEAKKKALLALDYEGVMAAWAGERSPWTTGDRPEVETNDSWPDYGGNSEAIYYPYGDHMAGVMSGHILDGGREARVSRYREKRLNRLFSKKIRYEVRKLNAEKRPRMKGRFVKRSNLAPPAPPAALT